MKCLMLHLWYKNGSLQFTLTQWVLAGFPCPPPYEISSMYSWSYLVGSLIHYSAFWTVVGIWPHCQPATIVSLELDSQQRADCPPSSFTFPSWFCCTSVQMHRGAFLWLPRAEWLGQCLINCHFKNKTTKSVKKNLVCEPVVCNIYLFPICLPTNPHNIFNPCVFLCLAYVETNSIFRLRSCQSHLSY